MDVAVLDGFPPELESLAESSPGATFYQTGVWLHSLAAAYPRARLQCLLARDGNDSVGYLPFFSIRRGPFRALWSLPFGTYGGPVSAGDGAADGVLLATFRDLVSRPGIVEASWVDFHNRADGGGEVTECETQIVDLTAGFDTIWSERFDKPRRRRVRRAEEQGVVIRDAGSDADVARFFEVYRSRLEAWREKEGHPERLFRELVTRGGGDRVRLHVAEIGGEIIGGHLNFYYKHDVIAWYGMASPHGDGFHAGTLLYATCIRKACEAGFATYNLGASLGKQSLIEYKRALGGVPHRYRTIRHRRLAGRALSLLRRLRATR